MKFTKVESVGNDYVLLDAVAEPGLARLDDLPHYTQAISHRRTGVGSDGVLILTMTERLLEMRVINADGSEGGVCGNGLRCAVKLAIERGYVPGDQAVRIAIGGRTIVATPRFEGGALRSVSVDMGPPSFGALDVPIDPMIAEHRGGARWDIEGREVYCASMGNPHAALFADVDPEQETGVLFTIGPRLCEHNAFPERTNVHLVRVTDRDAIRVVSWERGAGATMGCGTGVCAVVALGVREGILGNVCKVEVPGGRLVCGWSGQEEDGVWLEGPARLVFEGTWETNA